MLKKSPSFQIKKNVTGKGSINHSILQQIDEKPSHSRNLSSNNKYSSQADNSIENKNGSLNNIQDFQKSAINETGDKAIKPTHSNNFYHKGQSQGENNNDSSDQVYNSSEKKLKKIDSLKVKVTNTPNKNTKPRYIDNNESNESPLRGESQNRKSNQMVKKSSPFVIDKKNSKLSPSRKNLNDDLQHRSSSVKNMERSTHTNDDNNSGDLGERLPSSALKIHSDHSELTPGKTSTPVEIKGIDNNDIMGSVSSSQLQQAANQNLQQPNLVRGLFMREHISHDEVARQKEQQRLMKEYWENQINEKNRKKQEEKLKDLEFQKKEEERIRREIEQQGEVDKVQVQVKSKSRQISSHYALPNISNNNALDKRSASKEKSNNISSENTENSELNFLSRMKTHTSTIENLENENIQSDAHTRTYSPKMASVGRMIVKPDISSEPIIEQLKNDNENLKKVVSYLLTKIAPEEEEDPDIRDLRPKLKNTNSTNNNNNNNAIPSHDSRESSVPKNQRLNADLTQKKVVALSENKIKKKPTKVLRKFTPDMDLDDKMHEHLVSSKPPPQSSDNPVQTRMQRIILRNSNNNSSTTNKKVTSNSTDATSINTKMIENNEFPQHNSINGIENQKLLLLNSQHKLHTLNHKSHGSSIDFSLPTSSVITSLRSTKYLPTVANTIAQNIPNSSNYETATFRMITSPSRSANSLPKTNMFLTPVINSNINMENHFNFNQNHQSSVQKYEDTNFYAPESYNSNNNNHNSNNTQSVTKLQMQRFIDSSPSLDKNAKSELIFQNQEYGNQLPMPDTLSHQENISNMLMKIPKTDQKLAKAETLKYLGNMTLKPNGIARSNSKHKHVYSQDMNYLQGKSSSSVSLRHSMQIPNNILLVDEDTALRDSAQMNNFGHQSRFMYENGDYLLNKPPRTKDIEYRNKFQNGFDYGNNKTDNLRSHSHQEPHVSDTANHNNNELGRAIVQPFDPHIYDNNSQNSTFGVNFNSNSSNNPQNTASADKSNKFPKDIFSTNIKKKFIT